MIVPLTPVRFLYRAVDLFGKKTGIVSGAKRFTYAEFGERCERLATGLVAHGIKPGDRVAYLSFNNHQLLEGYYGVVMARAVVMPLNVRLTPAELIGILNHSGARVLIFENDFAPLVEQLRSACPGIERYVAAEEKVPVADLTYEQLLADGRPGRVDYVGVDENAIGELFYTSGSTGTPKGVTLSHRTLYLHGLEVATTYNPQELDLVELHTIPLFHANGWGRPQTATMLGLKQVMVRRFEPTGVFRLIQDERATSMALVPTMANALLNAPDLGKFDCSSMRRVFIGGAAPSVELIERMERAFHCTVMGGYGLTETAPVATSAHDKSTVAYKDDADRIHHRSMAGWPIPGCEVRVVDSEMHDVPRDMESIGEVVIRGDNVMDGYYKDPEGTKAVMTGAWLHTGDMAVWDEENYIHIVDRKKDIIISGGENISSIEVEKAIFAHPAVFECAVVSAPDARWGEIPVAFVVLKPGEKITQQELCGFLEKRIAKFKMPRSVEFVEGALPKTGTGKIVKRELREKFWAGKERRVQG
ncbi:MAG TPA: long-chain-fatty-acid--CoA ligase [Bryobacteraceae bacterium]|nr:long-chain-fatty-acid--CoA ligase [Bryobacteraceae bacterium]